MRRYALGACVLLGLGFLACDDDPGGQGDGSKSATGAGGEGGGFLGGLGGSSSGGTGTGANPGTGGQPAYCPGSDRIGETCIAGAGLCRREGKWACGEMGQEICDAVPGVAVKENCGTRDDADCDGRIGCEDPDCTCADCFYCLDQLCVMVNDGDNGYCPDDGNGCTREECHGGGCEHLVSVGGGCAAGSCTAEAVCQGPLHILEGYEKQRVGRSVSLGPDVDGDGRGDVLVGSPGSTVAGMLNAGRACLHSGGSGVEIRCWDGQKTEDYFGYSVSLGPDVDGDGKGDVLISSAPDGIGGGYFVGSAYLYSGATGKLLQTFAPNTSGQFGTSMTLGPDVDGDGRGDVLIGAPREDTSGVSDGGRAFLYSGATGQEIHFFTATKGYEYLGTSVSLGPDVDGDGRADVLIGSPGAGNPKVGRVDLYSGAKLTLLGTWTGTEEYDQFGFSVSLGPDADGDGKPDVMVGAFGAGKAGRAYLYSGATGTLVHTFEDMGENGQDVFGRAVFLGPDVDGDGRGDILLSAPEANGYYGRVGLYSGATRERIREWLGENQYAGFGNSIAIGPDFDGDGRADIVIGSPGAEPGGVKDAGRVYWFGSKGW
jgi:hypothetical protein